MYDAGSSSVSKCVIESVLAGVGTDKMPNPQTKKILENSKREKFKKLQKKFFQGLCDCTWAMSHCRTLKDPPIPAILANFRSVTMAKKYQLPSHWQKN